MMFNFKVMGYTSTVKNMYNTDMNVSNLFSTTQFYVQTANDFIVINEPINENIWAQNLCKNMYAISFNSL